MAEASARQELSQETLRAAYDACRARAARKGLAPWPKTLEEAMADPTLSRIVQMHARMGPRVLRDDEPPTAPPPRAIAPAAAPPPAPPRWQYPFKPPQPGAIDIKRRASGERDDD